MKCYFRCLVLILPLFALVWSGCGTDKNPSALDPEQQAEIAAKPSVEKKGISIEKLTSRRSITMVDGAVLEKSVFIFYKEGLESGSAGEEGALKNGKDKCKDCGKKCFALWAKDAEWRTTEPYAVDASGSGLSRNAVTSGIEDGLAAWDEEVAFDIFGELDKKAQVDGADDVAPDGKNEVLFGEIADPGIIAFTIVWGKFGGSRKYRELVEWDLVFNSNESWGDAGDTDETGLGDISVMDLQNIATHEIGHAAGLDHPSEQCTEETMYPFAERGETKKRTLHTGDIEGIKALYENKH